MKFLIQEYISLLKEDGELDKLITDLLISMNINPISKPQRGRQYGVDISAMGYDSDGVKKIFLIAVKQGNLTRSNWDSGVNSVRQTLNEIKDTYVSISLTNTQKKLPKKIIVCTNGKIEQNVTIDWTQYVNKNSIDKEIEYDFWDIGTITNLLETNLLTDKLFPSELQSLLRKTLAFIDVADYDMSHFYQLIRLILKSEDKQQKKVQKTIKLLQLCLNICYKWCQDINNLRPVFYASEKTLLNCWDWMLKRNLLNEKYAIVEFYKLHLLKLEIGRSFYNKTYNHYYVQHSIYRYSKNTLEYSLSVWEHVGILSTIGLSELFAGENNIDPKISASHYNNALEISKSLSHLIDLNPPSHYPLYDEHSIEIALALILLYKTKQEVVINNWLFELIIGIHDYFKIKKYFPLFRTNYDKLISINNGEDDCELDSSMLLNILVEWCVIMKKEELYQLYRNTIEINFPEINLQIWFPDSETEKSMGITDSSRESGSTKHSITLYEKMDDLKNEILIENEKFNPEIEFEFNKSGYYLLAYLSSRHFRSQPLPYTWRRFIQP